MAEYIHIVTDSMSPSTYEYETIAQSGDYEVEPFVPSVIEFDINVDDLTDIQNITVTSVGTIIPYVNEELGRKRFIYSDNRRLRWSFGTGTSRASVEKLTGSTWLSEMNGGFSSDDVGVAFVLIPNTNAFYVFIVYPNTAATSYFFSYGGYYSSSKVIKTMMPLLAGEEYQELSLELVSPPSRFFRGGQSSVITVKLKSKSGDTIASDILYECEASPGWAWDANNHVLSYSSGTYWTIVRASTEYNGVEYSEQFQFFPPSGTSPYQPGGNSGFGGGNGNFGQDDRNDNVVGDIPGGSNFGYIGGSIFTHYALSGSQAKHFGEWLWTDDLGLSLWKSVMEKLFNETADALVSLMCFPFNISTLPGVSLVDGNIIAGNLNTGISAKALSSPYVSVNWGLVTLNEYWGNFLDYAPHTKLELYLPWSTGFVPLDPHQCVPGSVSVTTNIDLQKGTCTHNVFAGNTVLGVYEGQCGYEVPLLASNFSAKLAGATITAVAGLSMGVAGAVSTNAYLGRKVQAYDALEKARPMLLASSGGDLDLYQQAYAGLRQTVMPAPYKEGDTYKAITTGLPAKLASWSSVATARQPVNVSRNGSFSGSSAGMSVPYPFIVISRPEQNVPTGYGHHFGYPSNITSILGQLKGYTEVGAVHLNGLKALPDEIAELDDILKGGFII